MARYTLLNCASVETIIEFTDNKALEAGKRAVTRGDPEATRKSMFLNLEILGEPVK